MQKNTKEDPLVVVITAIFRGIGLFFKTVFYGIKKLKNKWLLMILFVFILVSVVVYIKKGLFFLIDAPVYIQWLLYGLSLSLPVLYLFVLGSGYTRFTKSYQTAFEDINFIGKDKQYPVLISRKQEGRVIYLTFKSNIPFDTWNKSRSELETTLDCNIPEIEQPGSKKVVKLTAISSEHRIPANILWKDKYISLDDGVLVIGEDMLGQISFNLNKTPHVLIAGETGGGKSVLLREMLWQFIAKGGKPYMFDFKGGVEFGIEYENYGEVVTEREHALELLDLLVEENKIRLKKFRAKRAKNLAQYNKKTGENLSRIGVFCDEIGEMLDKQGATGEEKEFIQQLNGRLSTLARLARATGINLFLGTQRPDATVIHGQIKNNLTVRLCARLGDKPASEIVIGSTAAFYLPDIKGRFLFRCGVDTKEFQAYNFDDDTMLGDIDTTDLQVMLPELAHRSEQWNSQRADESDEEKDNVPKISKKADNSTVKSSDNEIKLDFNFKKKKAVNK